MPDNPGYAVDPTSLQGCRIRLTFHYQELQRETDPIVRANIAQYLAEAATELAQLEAEAARSSAA
ncbi:MAG: hypothetical protein MUF49_05940 [Oculatellaceae cyanobacterium Prado106]|jgi:hypothetical protein|nr:hypothetical protein [Oculatellaceae cyanobacterium Prado106]